VTTYQLCIRFQSTSVGELARTGFNQVLIQFRYGADRIQCAFKLLSKASVEGAYIELCVILIFETHFASDRPLPSLDKLLKIPGTLRLAPINKICKLLLPSTKISTPNILVVL